MQEIVGLKVNLIRVNNAKDTITIHFDNSSKVLALKSVAASYDTGIIGGSVTETKTNKEGIGVSFYIAIQKTLDPQDYFWFQIATNKRTFFEAALKGVEFGNGEEDD